MQSLTSNDHLVNFPLLSMVKQAGLKQAFVPGGDPGMGGGGAPPGGDPAAGGAPPGGGGAPPPDAGGGGGGDPMAALQPMIQQMVQQQMAQMGGGAGGGAGGAGGAAGGLKPKIDVNVEIMQMKNMMAKMCDHLGIQIPAQDMVATPDKLNAMAQGGQTASPAGTGAGGGGGGGAIGGVGGIDPMQGSGSPGGEKMGGYKGNGVSFDTSGFGENANKAQAVMKLRRKNG